MIKTIKLDLFSPYVERFLNELPDKMREGAIEAITESAELVLGIAQIGCKVRTGALRDSGRIERSGNRVSVKFGNALVNYAAVIEERYPYLRPAYLAVYPQIKSVIEKKVLSKIG